RRLAEFGQGLGRGGDDVGLLFLEQGGQAGQGVPGIGADLAEGGGGVQADARLRRLQRLGQGGHGVGAEVGGRGGGGGADVGVVVVKGLEKRGQGVLGPRGDAAQREGGLAPHLLAFVAE